MVTSISAMLDLLSKLDCNGSSALDLLAKLDRSAADCTERDGASLVHWRCLSFQLQCNDFHGSSPKGLRFTEPARCWESLQSWSTAIVVNFSGTGADDGDSIRDLLRKSAPNG